MIQFNMMVPYEERPHIQKMVSETFRIITTSRSRKDGKRFFLIESTEEDFSFLRLKYGNKDVWKR